MNLHMNPEGVIKIEDDFTEECFFGRGVRQGCCLSPVLFSLYAEMMIVEAYKDIDEGVKVGGRALRDIRYADDQAMMSSTENGLQEIMNKLSLIAEEYGMTVNAKMTKVTKRHESI